MKDYDRAFYEINQFIEMQAVFSDDVEAKLNSLEELISEINERTDKGELNEDALVALESVVSDAVAEVLKASVAENAPDYSNRYGE